MSGKILSHKQEHQKLINNWPEDKTERKKAIRRLYNIMCDECDAEIAQLKLHGFTSEQIYNMSLEQADKNIKRITENLEGKQNHKSNRKY